MMRRLYHTRRRSDPLPEPRQPTITMIPLVSVEGPLEHLRNALQLVRVFLDLGELVDGRDGPCVAVPVAGLAAVQARIEAALDGWARGMCPTCGGTILAPTIGGVPRGTCHCPRERLTDWSTTGAVEVRREP